MKTFSLSMLCLLASFTATTAIQHGIYAWRTHARFVASVRLRRYEQERLGSGFLCTATLINDYNVVTTATCVTFFLSSELQVVLGAVDLNMRSVHAVTRNVRRMFFHPTFERLSDTSEYVGNVAVLQLMMSVREPESAWSWIHNGHRNAHIQPIRMSSRSPDQFDRCTFFAWGHQSPDAERNPSLLMATLYFVHDNPRCTNMSTVFCAGDSNRGAAVCYNLGGSMVCDGTFFGIVITDSCQEPGHFHAIADYREWILVASGSSSLHLAQLLALALAIFVNKCLL